MILWGNKEWLYYRAIVDMSYEYHICGQGEKNTQAICSVVTNGNDCVRKKFRKDKLNLNFKECYT